jgi:tankyrase
MAVKHPFFEYLGENYPYALEARFDRILIKIEQLWYILEIYDYFSSLIIDSRGGR